MLLILIGIIASLAIIFLALVPAFILREIQAWRKESAAMARELHDVKLALASKRVQENVVQKPALGVQEKKVYEVFPARA